MNSHLAAALVLGGCLAFTLTGLPAPASAPITFRVKAGFAERDITPDLGMEMPGGYGKSFRNLKVSAGTQMADAGIALTGQLTPGKIPEPPKAAPFSRPWAYGAVRSPK